jgi:hypothetical protein
MQVFNKDQLHYIAKGQVHRITLRTQINEALNHNPFRENYVISSMPGLGKSFEMERALSTLSNPPLMFPGTASMPSFIIDVTTAVYLAKGQHLTVVLDDCDVIFEDANVNIAKKMFDDARILRYGKVAKGLYKFCTDLQIEAIESFIQPDSAGFTVPLNNVTFITLTNRHLPTVNEVDSMDPASAKHSKAKDLYAIRRRTEYKEIGMDNLELWGYVADVILNEKICEKFVPNITQGHKEQIATWMFTNWDKVTERNLSLAEKMTKDMVRYPNDYLDIWTTNYIQVK